MKDMENSEGEEAPKALHFFGFLDAKGRIVVPKRNRKEAGLMGLAADVECRMTVLKTYRKEVVVK